MDASLGVDKDSHIAQRRCRKPCEHEIGNDGHHDVRPDKVDLLPEVVLTLGLLRRNLGHNANATLDGDLDGERRVAQETFPKAWAENLMMNYLRPN